MEEDEELAVSVEIGIEDLGTEEAKASGSQKTNEDDDDDDDYYPDIDAELDELEKSVRGDDDEDTDEDDGKGLPDFAPYD